MKATNRRLTTDRVLQLVANRERRVILELLRQRGEAGVSIETLVAELTDGSSPWNHHSIDGTVEARIALHHRHLPKLVEYDAVTFHESSGTVEPGPEFDAVEPVLFALRRNADDLPTGYLPDDRV